MARAFFSSGGFFHWYGSHIMSTKISSTSILASSWLDIWCKYFVKFKKFTLQTLTRPHICRILRRLWSHHFWYTFLHVHDTLNKYGDFTNLYFTFSSEILRKFTGTYLRTKHQVPNGSAGHLLLGSDRLNVTVCWTCTVPLWDVQRTVSSWSYWKNILGWLALTSSSSPHLYSTVVFGITFWGEEGRMTEWL